MAGQGEKAPNPVVTGKTKDDVGSEFRTTRRHLKYAAGGAADQSAVIAVSPDEVLLSVASSVASQPLNNLDSSVWGVLTAISTVARNRPQGANMILNSNEHTIGRLVEDPRFKIDSSSVSGKHCKIYWKRVFQNEGESCVSFFLKDYSGNGTYLNRKKLTKSNPEAEVSHGDIISFNNGPHSESSYTFVFREGCKPNSLIGGKSEKSKADFNQHLLHLLNSPPSTKDSQHDGNEPVQPSFAVDPAVMEIGPPIMFPHQLYRPPRHQVPDSVASAWINSTNTPYSQQMPPVNDLYKLGFSIPKFGSFGDRPVESSVLRNPNFPDPARSPQQMHPPPGFSIIPQVNRDIQPSIKDLHVSSSNIETSISRLKLLKGGRMISGEENSEGDEESESAADSFLKEVTGPRRKQFSGNREARSDKRGQRILPQRIRFVKCRIPCRSNIAMFDAQFLSIYETLIPSKDEQDRQTYLLNKLQNLVKHEWPEAKLHLYGSCANSFGVSNSDIDVCLALNDAEAPDVLMKLAQLLKSHKFLDVQALPRARVPIVKLRDPETGIPCDICVNNMLAVANTKLLRDYSKIDVRLRQLVFIVKHWAKSRDVNETYKGTLSSYAYVLMCIHFLQLRGPPVLPCLQELEPTYAVTLEGTHCAYFDRVERIKGFGMLNKETISRLIWGFFNYWAYCHDYANDVVSVRSGCLISKRNKEWNRRVGFDRHLICIEDPFLLSHDLGRVVDKGSIRVLREEFERAAEIMQFDSNPCASLFAPYFA